MTSLDITFRLEEDENRTLLNAMQKGRKTALLNASVKNAFLQNLKSAM